MTAALYLAAITVLVVLIVTMAVICGVPKSRGAGTAFPPSRESRGGPSTSGRASSVLRPGTVDKETR